ncbi:MAG: VCBS repeat-containing protein [Bacteroidota bacterium]
MKNIHSSNNFIYFLLLAASIIILDTSCSRISESQNKVEANELETLFNKVEPLKSGIHFVNTINESPQLNYYTYKHMYIGAGAAAGDFNNDGLEDVYMVGNMSPNKLYLNKGDLKFEDITAAAGVEGSQGFYMGVTLVDINADGWLDIYLCKSGKYRDSRARENVLFINNGDLTFSERAADYGLNNSQYSVQSSFFDYDMDGDLDMFLVNTPVNFDISEKVFVLDFIYQNPEFRKAGGNDKLYRNDNGKYIDVTENSGILADFGFGLSVSTTDFNQDGWPDIFIANDFVAPDYLYINNQDGTFSEKSNVFFRHTSFYSMGSDAVDMNNDGHADLMVVDMNPSDYVRSKTTMQMMDRKLFNNMLNAGYNSIFMHNMVHMNTGMGSFSEVGNLTGMANTDWSWSVLAADFDLDGWKDVHISNGIYRDVLDRDKRNAVKNFNEGNKSRMTPQEVFAYLQSFPSVKLSNYSFKNKNGLEYDEVGSKWGLDEKAFSNGVAMADFDNDGDIDLLVNNLMDTAFLYENNAIQQGSNYLKVKLNGSKENPEALGAMVTIYSNAHQNTYLINRTRGYLSGSSVIAHFGLLQQKTVDSLKVVWPDGRISFLNDIESNQLLTVDYADSDDASSGAKNPAKYLLVDRTKLLQPNFTHRENDYDDYERQVLLPYSYSRLGPYVSVGDMNGDGMDDFYVGGASGQPGAVYLQNSTGSFLKTEQTLLEKDAGHEDMKSALFDYDNDGDLDLYVSSGGYEFEVGTEALQDRLYMNDGSGVFISKAELPDLKTSNSLVLPHDYDGDGDIDLFVGGRILPGAYPFEPKSYLLENRDGAYTDVIHSVVPDLEYIGMITDGEWVDIDGDEKEELVVVGEWMSINIFQVNSDKLVSVTSDYNLETQKGWWQSVKVINKNDGFDIVAGNIGRNIKHKASDEKPFHVYASDFDKNNSVDIILAKYYKDKQVPVRGKDCTTEQMPFIAEKFETFDEFASTDVQNMLGESIKEAKHFEITTFASKVFSFSAGSNEPEVKDLPIQAQVSSINRILNFDVNEDQSEDLVIAGNLFQTEVETTHQDAGTGLILVNNDDKGFKSINSASSGFYVPVDVKDMKLLERTYSKERYVIVTSNDGFIQLFGANP